MSLKVLVVGAASGVVVLLGVYPAAQRLLDVRTLTLIKKTSADGEHHVKLVTRQSGFDINVILEVDGARVYTSPDFVAPPRADLQESVMWDRTNSVVLVAVAGERLCGFHIAKRRLLLPAELQMVRVASFSDLGFTERLPHKQMDRTR